MVSNEFKSKAFMHVLILSSQTYNSLSIIFSKFYLQTFTYSLFFVGVTFSLNLLNITIPVLVLLTDTCSNKKAVNLAFP